MTVAIDVHDLTVAYRGRPVLLDIDLAIEAGQMTAIVGPNGAGKSTLLKAIAGVVPIASGHVHVFGRPLRGEGARRNASDPRQLAYVPQRETVDWDFPANVMDVVLMGRQAWLGWFGRPKQADRDAANRAIAACDLNGLETRQIGELSGGQQQRVFLARALAQEPQILLLDEPFASVDAATEQAIVRVLRDLRLAGRTVVAVHHDLQTVRGYFDRVAMLNLALVANGRVEDVFTESNLQRTYGGRLTLLSAAVDAMARARDGATR
ncbi:MAG: metal ABC transporter ATP-binding protein [Phycisphaerae bacterium]|nr:metal ABC transporter ATP-binding protein [Phycisphaerae bacterium]